LLGAEAPQRLAFLAPVARDSQSAMFRDAGFGESTAQELGPETLVLTKY